MFFRWSQLAVILCWAFIFPMPSFAQSAKGNETQQLLLADPLGKGISGGETHSFRIELKAGQFVRTEVSQKDIDLVVTLFGANRQLIVKMDGKNGFLWRESVSALAGKKGGQFTIEIRAHGDAEVKGFYQINIAELRRAMVADRTRLNAERGLDKGRTFFDDGSGEDLADAVKEYEAILPLWLQLKDKDWEAITLFNLGRTFSDLSQHEKAIISLEKALKIFQMLKDPTGEANAANGLGLAYYGQERFDRGKEYLERALTINRTNKNRRGEGANLNNLGMIYAKLSQPEEARRYLEQALFIAREMKNLRGEGLTLNILGDVYIDLLLDDLARDSFQKAIAIADEIGDPGLKGLALSAMGGIPNYGNTNNAGDRENLEKALSIGRERKDLLVEASTLLALGNFYFLRDQTEEAKQYYEQALSVYRTMKDVGGEGDVAWNLLLVWKELENPSMAIVNGKLAVNAYQKTRSNIKSFDKKVRQTYLAEKEFHYRQLANILISESRLSEAQSVLDMLKEDEYGQLSTTRGGEVPETMPYSRAETGIIAKIEMAAALQREQGDLQKEQKEKGRLTDDKQKRLDRLLSDIEDANRAFREALDVLGKSEESVEARVAEIEGQRNLQRILGQLGRETNSGVVALYTVIGTQEVLDSSEDEDSGVSKTGLKFGWVILVTPEGRKAYPIDVQELEETVFAFRAALSSDKYDPEPLARKLYDKLFRQTSDKQKQTLEDDLRVYLGKYKDKTLMWSLDSVLRYVPTAALHDGTGFLVEKYRNVTFTKKSFLTLTEKDATLWKALGLGVSEARKVENLNFNALPEVERELHDVVRQTRESTGILNGTRRLNQDFTRDGTIRLWREGKYPVIHIASHYSFNPADQAASFLLVGDGKLTFGDIQGKDNLFGTVDLLTLSACDTAMSSNGKESEGFAFMAQDLGAKTVIASLWKVSDAGTPELMIRFYKLRAANPQMAKGEAFRQAQLSLLNGEAKAKMSVKMNSPSKMGVIDLVNKRFEVPLYDKMAKPPFAHPHYWSSFIMIGNWR